jgi:hypothetical protein
MQKQKAVAQKKHKLSDAEETSALSAGKRTMKCGFNVRDAKIGHMKTDGGFCFCDICADE